jgi:hypothetical protein
MKPQAKEAAGGNIFLKTRSLLSNLLSGNSDLSFQGRIAMFRLGFGLVFD